ncbi:MAG: ribose 5-phosphate isomerase B [Brevinema sp.]
MKISLGADHGGFELKEAVKKWLISRQFDVQDFGTHSTDSVDYIDFVYPATESVSNHESDKAIVFCGTGLGASYVANKVKGIRAALCDDEFTARLSRQHNDANVLVLGGRVLTSDKALAILEVWLTTPFEGGRHQARIDKITQIEEQQYKKHHTQ